jgi:hypothetical protein
MKACCAQSKEAKVQSVACFFQAGNVKIPSSDWMQRHGLTDWTPGYVQELTQFPKVRFNDQADATAMGVWRLLHTFQAHVSAAMIMAPDAGNVGLVADTFDLAYASEERVGQDLSSLAFGRGTGIADTFRGAFGS